MIRTSNNTQQVFRLRGGSIPPIVRINAAQVFLLKGEKS